MIREIIAVVLLVIIFSLLVFNIGYYSRITDELLTLVNEAERLTLSGDCAGAAVQIQTAADRWTELDSYTHVMIRHSEINEMTDAFYELLSDLLAGDAGSAQGSIGKLRDHLVGTMKMERITFGSIF